MVTLLVSLSDSVAAAAIAAAIDAGISLDTYIDRRLSATLALDKEGNSAATPDPLTAQQLFDAALRHAANEPYRVEDLYRAGHPAIAWERLPAGRRISIGRTFRKLVDAQAASGRSAGESARTVELVGTTSQNQAIYRTTDTHRRSA